MIIGNPIPEEFSMNPEKMHTAIEAALKQADERDIKGKAVTPFLLESIKELTGGESLNANIALIKNNALLGAKIARELNDMKREQ